MTAIVGVFPPRALAERARLFAALGAVFHLQFEGREHGAWDDLDAAIIIGQSPHEAPYVPALRYAYSENVTEASSRATPIDLSTDAAVDARLRGRRLTERSLVSSGRLQAGRPLARDDNGIVWASDDSTLLQTCLVAPTELAPDEPLRDRLRGGRFLALLPLIQLLRRVVRYETWSRPSIRAVFQFDDPNLHWPSYGHIRFADLAAHTNLHGYHVAFSTIPLDCWWAHPGALRAFRAARCFSLSLHGNDHLYQELALPRSAAESVGLVAQALNRVHRFEARTGLSVDRVMVPPHGLCSDEMYDAMVLFGIEALCRAPVWWSHWPRQRQQIADWHMADVSPSGMPILRRHRLLHTLAREETMLSVFLDQPVVLYGHHYDVSSGYEVLADTAEWLGGFGEVSWQSLGSLGRSNYESRTEPGGALRVRSYSRSCSVSVPEEVGKVLFEVDAYDAVALDRLVARDAQYELTVSNGVAQAEIPSFAAGRLEIWLERRVDAPPTLRPTIGLHPIVRRAVAETRDRLQPLVQRTGLNPLLRRLEAVYDRRMRARLSSPGPRGD